MCSYSFSLLQAYVKSFSAALRVEYGGTGITIQHLAPMFVNTKMNNFSEKLRKTSFLVPDAEQYARYAISTLGKTNLSSGYWTHGIQVGSTTRNLRLTTDIDSTLFKFKTIHVKMIAMYELFQFLLGLYCL